jgi:radical SAM superfamily enzyme
MKNHVLMIQRALRKFFGKRKLSFMRKIKAFRAHANVMKHFKESKLIHRLTRDKESYYVQRYALAKVEIDSISKYLQKAEEKFDSNWQDYEN